MSAASGEGPRIVSLIASATEIVAALGMGDRLVGISHECDFPEEVLDRPRLSAPKLDPSAPSAEIDRDVRALVSEGLSVYRVDVDALQRVRPDVIVTQDHCEVCAVSLADVEAAVCGLELPGTSVCSLHPGVLEDVRRDFRRVAASLGVPERGERLVADFDERLEGVRRRVVEAGVEPLRVVILEWLEPPMVAGGWMPELAVIAGARPLVVEEPGHFRQVGWSDVELAEPEAVLLLPCGFDVARSLAELTEPTTAAALRSLEAVREGRCFVLDGNAFFNRPGPRLADSAELLAAVLHPAVFPGVRERYAGAWTTWG